MRWMWRFVALMVLQGATACTPGFLGAQEAAHPAGRVVLVLPFENRSGNPSLNWISDSFPDTLNRRLNTSGFLTISHDDRVFAYDHLGLPSGFRPSRATTIRIAQQLDANYVIVGDFNVQNDHLSADARVLSVDALRLSAQVQDSAELPRLFDAENAIAWKVARTVDPQFNVAESTFIGASANVSLPAFEDFIRGTNASAPSERLQRLKAAVQVSPAYAPAWLALGKEQYLQRDYASAATSLGKVPASDPLALEANFYIGLARFNSLGYAAAETAFHFVAEKLPLPEVVNDEGVAASRQGKDAVPELQRASAADPSNEDYHYNLAIALFRRGDTAAALSQTALALKLKPNDNEAIQLDKMLRAAPAGTKLTTDKSSTGFLPVERLQRAWSETSYRQAAFQLSQMRALRLATLTPQQRATEYVALGQDSLRQGMLPEAESNFKSALDADKANAAAHAGLAEVREHSGFAAEARAEAHTSLRLQPNVPALLVLARLDMADNAPQLAADEISQALQLSPKDGEAQLLKQTLQSRGQAVR